MAATGRPSKASAEWDTCQVGECIGARLHGMKVCWAHASDDQLKSALRDLHEHGHVAGRGVTFYEALWQRVLGAARKAADGQTVLTDADFTWSSFHVRDPFADVVFEGDAHFDHASFYESTKFDGASFRGDVSFEDARFRRDTWFQRSTVAKHASFAGAGFTGKVWFGVTFAKDAVFTNTSFEAETSFSAAAQHDPAFHSGTRFGGNALFREARFGADVTFTGVVFKRDAFFNDAMFEGAINLRSSKSHGDVAFVGSTFDGARQLGPMLVEGRLDLGNTLWRQPTRIDAITSRIGCEGARFLGGVEIRTRWADVVLDNADLALPSSLSHAPPFAGLEEDSWSPQRTQALGVTATDSRPLLLSVCGADVAGLAVSRVDLRACRFVGAHNLDRLQMNDCELGAVPQSWWYTGRSAIAEEQHWRARFAKRSQDQWKELAGGDSATRSDPPGPIQVASIYRELRKAKEDRKDEPGAADFYYGEMEMRRQATHRAHRRVSNRAATAGEHAILTLYWLLAGYGLRAWRALVSLVVLVMVATVAFDAWGMAGQEGSSGDQLAAAVVLSAQAATAVLGDADTDLTRFGEWLHLGLRLSGPVLLGLAVLSIRGRVRR